MCGGDAGEDSVVISGDTVCDDCLSGLDIQDLLELLGLCTVHDLVSVFEDNEI